jgi:hypothetical protein
MTICCRTEGRPSRNAVIDNADFDIGMDTSGVPVIVNGNPNDEGTWFKMNSRHCGHFQSLSAVSSERDENAVTAARAIWSKKESGKMNNATSRRSLS